MTLTVPLSPVMDFFTQHSWPAVLLVSLWGLRCPRCGVHAVATPQVFFADLHPPWQRPSNENSNGLLQQNFPKGTDLSRWTADELEAVAHVLNNRLRKTLGWKTPAEVFEEQVCSLPQAGVASTS